LNRDLDQWNPFPRDRPLGAHYGLVARAGERLWEKRWLPGWGRYWNQHWGTCGEAVECHTAWLGPRDRRHDAHLRAGRWVFGISVGLLTAIIRIWGGLPEGVMYAILIMNALTPFINQATQPRVFGVRVGKAA